jgi:single-strand DNA-binding protein
MNNNNIYNTNNFVGTIHQDYFKSASNALASNIYATSNTLEQHLTTTSNILENHSSNFTLATSNILQYNSSNFTIATNDYYINDKGEKIEQTEWHRVTAWGKVAEIIEKYVTKGKEVAIEGKLTHRTYDDKDGNKRYVTDVVVNDILLLDK